MHKCKILTFLKNHTLSYFNFFFKFAETPSFVKPMENKEVAIGGSIVLECMASGSPRPELSWRKNGSPLQATERHFFTAENQLLIIVNAVLSDAGTYECELSNSLGSVIGSSFVTVKDDIKSKYFRFNLRMIKISLSGSWFYTFYSTGTPSLVNEDDILGLIVITVVCCAVGTSIIWVVIIYQTRRRLNNHNNSRKVTVIMSTEPQADSHLNVDTSSQHSKDSGTGGSANPSDNQLHIYTPGEISFKILTFFSSFFLILPKWSVTVKFWLPENLKKIFQHENDHFLLLNLVLISIEKV